MQTRGAFKGVAEAIRPAAKLPGLWREASPSAAADSVGNLYYTHQTKNY